MYGKIFESLFTGSMVGSGSHVFAVWSYVLANTKPDGMVELNPVILATILGESKELVLESIQVLCAPDPYSRNKAEEGRRLIKEGEFIYRVVTYPDYRNIRNDEERREYFRVKKQEQRAREKAVKDMSKTVKDSQTMSTVSTHSEAEVYTEEEKIGETPSSKSLTDHQRGLQILQDVVGKYPDGAAQAKALKWMLKNGASLEQIETSLRSQYAEYSVSGYRCSFLTLQKTIFQPRGNGKDVVHNGEEMKKALLPCIP